MMKSTIKQIDADQVVINTDIDEVCIKNDVVIVCAGGILPTEFLKSSGINVVTKYGAA